MESKKKGEQKETIDVPSDLRNPTPKVSASLRPMSDSERCESERIVHLDELVSDCLKNSNPFSDKSMRDSGLDLVEFNASRNEVFRSLSKVFLVTGNRTVACWFSGLRHRQEWVQNIAQSQ